MSVGDTTNTGKDKSLIGTSCLRERHTSCDGNMCECSCHIAREQVEPPKCHHREDIAAANQMMRFAEDGDTCPTRELRLEMYVEMVVTNLVWMTHGTIPINSLIGMIVHRLQRLAHEGQQQADNF